MGQYIRIGETDDSTSEPEMENFDSLVEVWEWTSVWEMDHRNKKWLIVYKDENKYMQNLLLIASSDLSEKGLSEEYIEGLIYWEVKGLKPSDTGLLGAHCIDVQELSKTSGEIFSGSRRLSYPEPDWH